MKVLVSSGWLNQDFIDRWKVDFPNVEFVGGSTEEEQMAVAGDVEVAFGAVTENVVKSAPNLKWVQSSSAGVEWMRHAPSLIDSDIQVTNTRGAHATTIAEHTFGMLVFLARRFDETYEAQKRHEWIRGSSTPRTGLVGLTMGIIGLGQIGRAIAKRAHAFEMNVIAVDVNKVPKPDYVSDVQLLDGLPNLMRTADVVVIAIPITDETRGMVTPELLKMMKPNAYLLVMSRGGIIHEPTLAQMLRDGELAGAGLDVTAIEPLPADNELWDCPNIIITPHNSPSSDQTRANVMSIMKENLRRYLDGQPLNNLVDKEAGY
ncbi:MAG: D-2-hydroxyacid dehydrogenase [Caldilineaceae bacterium]